MNHLKALLRWFVRLILSIFSYFKRERNMSKVSTWSTTAASNNAAVPDGWPEGQLPSTVNNCARENMAAIAAWLLEFRTGAQLSATAALAVNVAGFSHNVDGADAITSFAAATNDTSKIKVIQFNEVLTLTHHSTNLILPGGDNITTAAGDVGVFYEYGAGTWRCIAYAGKNGYFSNITSTSTDAGASAGPSIEIYRNSATPAAADFGGRILFTGKDSAGKIIYATIGTQFDGVTNSSDVDAAIIFYRQTDNLGLLECAKLGAIVTSALDGLTLTDTSGGGSGPAIELYHASASPANNDVVGSLIFAGRDNAANPTQYGDISVFIDDVTDGSEDATMRFRTVRAGSTQVAFNVLSTGVISTTNGISFGDETLVNYDEGTFVPVVADATSGGNASATACVGRYVRVGKQVTVWMEGANISTVGLTAGNDVFVRGLPFTSETTDSINPMGPVALSDVTFTGQVDYQMVTNATYGRFAESASGTALDFLIVSEFSSGAADFQITITYEID